MKRKTTFFMFALIVSVVAMAGVAFAAERVEVKVTSEPIGYHALCDKAGGWSLEWDTATVLTDGDIITIDMPTNPATGEVVTICKSFDIEISPSGAGSFWTGALPAGNIPVADCPFVDEQGSSTITAGTGIIFRIVGTAGENRVTLYIIGESGGDALEIGRLLEDNLILSFLDQALNASYTVNGVWKYGTTTPAELADNTLCINVEAWNQPVVLANMDSMGDKYTFIPSNPQIAHIVPSNYALFDCKAKTPGYIEDGYRGGTTQTGPGEDHCYGFDNDSSAAGSGYCDGTHWRNYFIVEKTMGTWDASNYTIEMQLLVKGASGDNGFYFTDQSVKTKADTAISDPRISGLCAYAGGGSSIDTTYASGITPVASSNSCDVAASARATWLETVASDLGVGGGHQKFLLVDIPMIHYDLDEIAVDDVVSVKITIKKAPCGTVFEDTIVIGTYGCRVIPPAEQTSCLTFPYFTAVNDPAWWAGIVITNLADNDGTAKIKIYEKDGDQGEATVDVGALSQYVGLLSNLSFTKTSGTGTIGDSKSFIVVCFTGSATIDGFAMMGDGTQAQGYLPRNCDCSHCSPLCSSSE